MAALRYNERTGEFEDRSTGFRSRGGCKKRLFQIFLAVAAFAATVWGIVEWRSGCRPSADLGGATASCGGYSTLMEYVNGFFTGCWRGVCNLGDWVFLAAMIAAFALFARYYAKALADVKRGRLTVYIGWEDFFRSAAWIVAIPFGLVFAANGGDNLLAWGLSLAMVWYGVKSFVRMVKGAFRYNSGTRRWLALFARVAVILLLLFALSELQSRYERYKRGQLGFIRGVLLPLAIFAYCYKAFVAPMISSHLYGLRNYVQR